MPDFTSFLHTHLDKNPKFSISEKQWSIVYKWILIIFSPIKTMNLCDYLDSTDFHDYAVILANKYRGIIFITS